MDKNDSRKIPRKLPVLNRIFSRRMLKCFIENDNLDLYRKIALKYYNLDKNCTNQQIIKYFYKKLKEVYQNEYLYKNTLFFDKVGTKKYFKDNSALTEISLANSKVDFLFLNNHAEAIEIKTPLDNLERLESQLLDYYKVCSYVTIFTEETKEKKILELIRKIDKPIGLCILSNEFKVETRKKPESYTTDLQKELIFKILRKSEVEQIIIEVGEVLPKVSQFEYYKACLKKFIDIPLNYSYPIIIKKLKRRNKTNFDDFKNIPKELGFLGYSMNLKKQDYDKLNAFLKGNFKSD